MIHELIDPRKKANKTSASRNVKILLENKTAFENCNFEARDCEHKEAEFSSTTFIPPWLKNSLGLNQRNNLSHTTASSEIKSAKIIQRGKEPGQNEFDLKANIEQDCCKKATNHFAVLSLDTSQEDNITKSIDNVETFDSKNDREISTYWDVRTKDSETESSCANAETKSLVKEDSKMTNSDIMTSAEMGRLKEEEKKKLRLIKQKIKLKKRNTGDEKQLDLDKSNTDFLMEVKGREPLDSFTKSDATSEMKNLEAKLTPMSAKSLDMSNAKLNQQELRLLQDIKNQGGNVEEVEKLFEQVKEMNMREIIKNPDFLTKNVAEKRREDKEEKISREVMQKYADDGKSNGDKDSLLSTDDENDIKRFSEFLSKNKNLDEKRKCLEEVRNYFEKKRRTRMTKRRFLEEEKSKPNPDTEIKEEHSKDKLRYKSFYRGRKSKFALCDEEVVEKAVDEALQKFVEMYHIHVTPTVMGNMKKNILQAMTSDSLGSRTKLTESASVKKTNLEVLNTTGKESEKVETHSFQEAENAEISNKETIHKEIKKKNFKTLIENSGELGSKSAKESDMTEDEKLKRLRKEFDNFLYSVQNNTDVTSLKLQSVMLEKDDQIPSSKNVQFVYNFIKKALEPEKAEYFQNNSKESSGSKIVKDSESQTAPESESIKRNVKVQTFEQKSSCEESLQTDDTICVSQSTQTNDEVVFREIKELTNCDVSPGLYRMVKSKEAGKFYLYPEQMQDTNQDAGESGNSSAVKVKKINKKRELLNILTKEKAKERRVFFRDREKTKLKKSKKTFHALAHHKGTSPQEEKSTLTSGNSVSCLYFRDFDRKNSESLSSKKELDLTDENVSEKLEDNEEQGLGDAKEEMQKEDHLGCFWFWNGEKITPGCDLKTHVEELLKEKLKEITNFASRQSEYAVNTLSLSKDKNQQSQISQKNLDVRNANAIFCFSNVQDGTKENALVFTENECIKEINKIERKKNEDEDTGKTSVTISEEKSVRNAATQNSQHAFLSLNLSQLKIQSKMSAPIRRKFNKRNIIIKPSHGRTVNLKRAEDIIRAFEELRKVKLGLENSKRENSLEGQSIMDSSISSSDSKNGVEDHLSMVFGLKNRPEVEEISNLDIRNKIKKLISFVDREIQTTDTYNMENINCVENQVVGNHKHLELIGSVLNRVSHREREDLWNDVREFIKTKIGKDINDEGAREVCIEIEQDMPKNEQGKRKHTVLAKGHYTKNEGDVEVEIDLTLDDLEKILRQRQKKNRRRTLYSSRKSKNLLSSSSIQSDFTKDDLRRYQKYLNRFAVLKGGFVQDQDVNAFLEK